MYNVSVWSSECGVALAPAHRGVGASTAWLWLAQTRLTPFWKTAVWRHNLFLVVRRRYPEKTLRLFFLVFPTQRLFFTTRLLSVYFSHTQPASFSSAQFGVAAFFCPTARKLNWGSMVLNFHCNKWITGGDPTKVSGGALYWRYVCAFLVD